VIVLFPHEAETAPADGLAKPARRFNALLGHGRLHLLTGGGRIEPRAETDYARKRKRSDAITYGVFAHQRFWTVLDRHPAAQNLTRIDLTRAGDFLLRVANHFRPLRHPA
jgi:hypothetical protein